MNEIQFTPGAEDALRLSQEAAGELGHAYVGTEHILLGLMRANIVISLCSISLGKFLRYLLLVYGVNALL